MLNYFGITNQRKALWPANEIYYEVNRTAAPLCGFYLLIRIIYLIDSYDTLIQMN